MTGTITRTVFILIIASACQSPPPTGAPPDMGGDDPFPVADAQTQSSLDCKLFILKRGTNITHLLRQTRLSRERHTSLIEELRKVLPLRRIQPGLTLETCWAKNELRHVVVKPFKSSFEIHLSQELDGAWSATKIPIPKETRTLTLTLRINSSLSEAVNTAGADPSLLPLLAEVLAWDIDLRKDVRRGDSIRLVVEASYTDEGEFIEYETILAVDYDGELRQFNIFGFQDAKGQFNYFDGKGRSIKRNLLRTPLRFVRVSSVFSAKRKHPILGYTKAHHGVDYAAPSGTPVWSIGDGRVTYAGWKGPNGKLVKIDHGNGLTSAYAHLSSIQRDLRPGVKVKAKQIIGKVGTTGRSTGPHLHFAMTKNGRFIDPTSLTRNRSDNLPTVESAAFSALVKTLKMRMNASVTMDPNVKQ